LGLTLLLTSLVAVTGCSLLPPETPAAPTGPDRGAVGATLQFNAVTIDPQNLMIGYQFDWGDGQTSDWSPCVPSGMPVTMEHAWRTTGMYEVNVRGRNIAGKESDFSPAHVVQIGCRRGYPDTVIATIPVGGDPTDIAVTPNGRLVYVANELANYVTAVDVRTRAVVARIACGNYPLMVAARPGNEYVYASCGTDDKVAVIRTSDQTVTDWIRVGSSPHRLCFSASGDRCYVANQNSSTISVIRTSDNTVVASVPVGDTPRDVDCLPNGEFVYTANLYEPTLTVVRTSDNTAVGTVNLGFTAHRVRAMPGSQYVYVTEYHGDRVAKVRTSDNAVVATFRCDGAVIGMCFINDGEYLYVATHHNGGEATVIRTSDNTVVDHIPTGSCPYGVRAPANEAYVATSDRGCRTVTIIGRGCDGADGAPVTDRDE